MKFWAAQRHWKRYVFWLIVAYGVGAFVFLIVNAFLCFLMAKLGETYRSYDFISYLQSPAGIWVLCILSVCFCLGVWVKYLSLSYREGMLIYRLKGEVKPSFLSVYQRRRVKNIVEELSLAANIVPPPIYYVPRKGVNAFFCRGKQEGPSIVVTEGAVQILSRGQLEALLAFVIAEFRDEIASRKFYLYALLGGVGFFKSASFLALNLCHRVIKRQTTEKYPADKVIAGILFILSAFWLVLGGFGELLLVICFGYISQKQKYYTDAKIVQYLRNSDNLASLLKLQFAIDDRVQQIPIGDECLDVLFFSSAMSPQDKCHFQPPILDRIYQLEPHWRGDFQKEHGQLVRKGLEYKEEDAVTGLVIDGVVYPNA